MRHSRGYPSWYWVNQAELAWDVRITRYTMTNTAQIQSVPAPQHGGAIQSLGAGVLAVYLFCVYSRVLDPLLPSAHLPALMSVIMLLVIAFSGSVHEILQASPVRKVVFLTFWMFASLPTSYWRGGSIAAIQQQWIPAVIPMVALAGLGISLRRVMAVLRVLFVAAIFTALLARVFPNYMAGRLSGTLGNPNDLAAVLVVGLALSWFIFSSVRPLGRVALCLTTAPILLALLQTGSRGGMLALLILGVTVFARLPMSGRISMFAICCVGVLVAGIGWLAHATHATPYLSGYPTVLAQEAQIVFGSTFAGHALFYLVQLATMLILYTGGNTSFNGFPFLTSYVAGDSFLPRWLLKRGHRLVFSNAIIVLTITSVALLIIKDADVNSLVPLYAIGVFTAFTMAGFGMAKYHHTRREPGWRHKFGINFAAGTLSAIVVIIFAVVKFTEGAWVVLVLFAIFVPALIRLNARSKRS